MEAIWNGQSPSKEAIQQTSRPMVQWPMSYTLAGRRYTEFLERADGHAHQRWWPDAWSPRIRKIELSPSLGSISSRTKFIVLQNTVCRPWVFCCSKLSNVHVWHTTVPAFNTRACTRPGWQYSKFIRMWRGALAVHLEPYGKIIDLSPDLKHVSGESA